MCWSTSLRTRNNRSHSAVLLRTSSYSYCRTFRTPTTQYCLMILARRCHQTALVKYVETYERNPGSRKRKIHACAKYSSSCSLHEKGVFMLTWPCFCPLHTVSAWVQHGFRSWVPETEGATYGFRRLSETMLKVWICAYRKKSVCLINPQIANANFARFLIGTKLSLNFACERSTQS